jgi:dUTP pyrophosphatase
MKFKRLHAGAAVPQRMSPGAACFDLVAADDGAPHENDWHAWVFGTGLAFEIPPGFVMLIFSRSGHGFGQAVRLSNCVGVIDSDYRGEVKVSLRADGQQPRRLGKGDRIAQAMLVELPTVFIEEVDELTTTDRGAGGFGSTGN